MNNNPFKNKIIEFHIIQSFPVSCLNRDDVGSPKSAIVGGVQRARVSSQCWKRQVRLVMQNFGVKLAIRSKKVTDFVAKECTTLGANEEQASACGEEIAKAFSKDTLHFFTEGEAQAFAIYAQEREFDSSKIKDKEIQKLSKKVINPAIDGLDIALFGRMVAQAAELNVEASCSFSHAISTHKVSSEVEFFTALDDLQTEENAGSAHMGSLEFNSATYYRYISLNLGQLYDSLAGEDLSEAIDAFTKALFLAVPNARQTTQSAASPWEYAKVFVRKGQRLQVPFEKPVKTERGGGYLQPSIDAMESYLATKQKLSGSLFGKLDEYTFGEDENFSIDDLCDALKSHARV
nr:type I-E CRISPR-associated protein Cas7/Cse4/CasC [Rhodospirillales bacterium]